MPQLILHHYWGSPYAEKIRLLFGYLAIAWRSLEIAPVPPRPSLLPVLGEFRRTPVLQSGADFFCDTRLIGWVLAEMRPALPLITAANRAVCDLICGWAEPRVFVMTGPVRFQTAQDVIQLLKGTVSPAAFQQDRTPFMAPAIEPSRFAELGSSAEDHLRAYLRVSADLLGTRAWLGGTAPCFADFAVYHLVWWLRASPRCRLLDATPCLDEWAERMARFGHGEFTPADPQDSLVAVRTAQDSAWRSSWPAQPDGRLGSPVSVTPDDYGRSAVRGVLIESSERHVSLRCDSAQLGVVRVHLPRLGYQIV